MRKMLLNVVLPLIGVLVFNTLGMTAHASMNSSHGSHGTSHVTKTLSCASLCMSLPVSKGPEEKEVLDNDNKDDYEEPDFTTLLQSVSDSAVHERNAYAAAKFDPPPAPPGYILNAVFRV